jgi:uncharacterized membrane protein
VTGHKDLEDRLLWIVKIGVLVSGLALAAGLALHVVQGDRPASRSLLAVGLVVLMAVPGLRVIIATADRVGRRDWYFVAATVIVLVELSLTMWFAARRV